LSVTVILVAPGTSNSTVEVVKPSLHECFAVLFDNSLNPAKFGPTNATTSLQYYRVEPELGKSTIGPDMYMRWLISIT
jgi:hypothetical protein